jgi:hypothetical protein
MTTQYQDIVLTDRPALFLPMNEASGPFLDLTGNGYDAAVFGAFTRNSAFTTVGGAAGTGAIGNGGFAISPKGDLPFGDSWSIEAWIAGTATASWFGSAQGLSWILQFAGDLDRNDGTYNTVAQLLYYYQGGSGATQVFGGSSAFTYAYYPDANLRDDRNTYGWEYSSGVAVVSGSTPLPAYGRTHVVVRRPPGHGRSVDNNYTNVCKNGVYLGESVDPSAVFPARKNGVGLFGKPTSANSIYATAAQTTWLSSVAMYDYCLTDAQVLRHYQAGIGTLANNRVAGSTLLDGVATGGFPVFVHRRDTGALLGRTVSDASGAFSCNVGTYASQVYAVAFDPVSGKNYPAQIFDLIVPST